MTLSSSITTSEINQIRKDVSAFACNLPCIIQRLTRVPDGMGGSSETWQTIESTSCGMTEPSAGQLQNYDFLIGSLAAWQIKLPYGTNINHQDHLLVTGSYFQQTLVVQVVLEPRSYASLVTVLASEIK